MMLKNSYVISGETLQGKTEAEIISMRVCFSTYKFEKSETEADFYYMLYKQHKAVLKMLLELQGNSGSEISMIINMLDPKNRR